MNHLQIKHRGTVLIIAFITMGVLLLLGVYFLSFTLAESRIAKSQTVGTQAYYLAEAGINQAIWKLKHEWKNDFETNLGWSANFTQPTDELIPNSTTTVTIQNSTSIHAKGEITATSTIALPRGKTAQRVVKTGVFKAIGSPIGNIAVFSGGKGKHDELKIKNSKIYVKDGHIFTNHDVKIERKSEVKVENAKILEVKKYRESDDSSTTAYAYCSNDTCHTTSTCNCTDIDWFQESCEPTATKCPPKPKDLPMVDFNSTDLNSYKNQALTAQGNHECKVFCQKEGEATSTQCSDKCVFSWFEFAWLLWFDVGKDGTMTLDNDVTYVKDSIYLRGGRDLIVNGVLVSEGNIEIGKRYWWKWYGEKYGGDDQLIINNEAGKASGLLSKGKIEFGEYASFPDTVSGLLYALKEVKLKHLSNTLTVEGGIITKKIRFENFKDIGKLNVYFSNSIVGNTLGNPAHSPVISIEHWEESY